MSKGYENYEKLKDYALRTTRAVMNCTSAMDIYLGGENFLKLPTEILVIFFALK